MATINHVFVLMLENQSFDRLLGQSVIKGFDPVTSELRSIDGSDARMSNQYEGKAYNVTAGAPWAFTSDPNHEFEDVYEQLTGEDFSKFRPGQPYTTPNNSGFVKNYAKLNPANLGDIMSGYTPDQLPIINALAREFAVCDKWFSSLPGPTWPNRFFVHGGSSGGLDHSPSMAETAEWEVGVPGGFAFQKGSIYDHFKKAKLSFRFYRGNRFLTDDYPIVAALTGIEPKQSHPIDQFDHDLQNSYDPFFTFIEPSYGNIVNSTYAGGTSQHPMDDVRGGERLIKDVYESIRKSPLWNTSLLIITWDEHGGFFDHVTPPPAVPPGDKVVTPQKSFWQKIVSLFTSETKNKVNKFGFTFNQYGLRVPAVVISPWIPKNTVDGTLYDHASIPATLRDLRSQLPPLTKRVLKANSLAHLLSLSAPRQDTPMTLQSISEPAHSQSPEEGTTKNIDHGNAPGFAYLALRNQLSKANSSQERKALKLKYSNLKTHGDLKAHYESAK